MVYLGYRIPVGFCCYFFSVQQIVVDLRDSILSFIRGPKTVLNLLSSSYHVSKVMNLLLVTHSPNDSPSHESVVYSSDLVTESMYLYEHLVDL